MAHTLQAPQAIALGLLLTLAIFCVGGTMFSDSEKRRKEAESARRRSHVEDLVNLIAARIESYDAAEGSRIWIRVCSSCHRPGSSNDLGSLAADARRERAELRYLIRSVLDPEAESRTRDQHGQLIYMRDLALSESEIGSVVLHLLQSK